MSETAEPTTTWERSAAIACVGIVVFVGVLHLIALIVGIFRQDAWGMSWALFGLLAVRGFFLLPEILGETK